MKKERVYLFNSKEIFFDAFIHSDKIKRGAVVVCPGGAYTNLADHEGDPVALKYYEAGFNAFTLHYSIKENATFFNPLRDLSVAIKTIREKSEDYNIDVNKIAVVGFSAGGHLSLSLGALWNNPKLREVSNCKNEENKPNAIILGYPVCGARFWYFHKSIFDVLTKGRTEKEGKELLHNPKNVGPHTPPVFLFSTFYDNCVPIEESLELMQALAKNNIPFESHIYPNGRHGLGLAENDSDLKRWNELSIKWLSRLFKDEDKNEPRATQKITEEI